MVSFMRGCEGAKKTKWGGSQWEQKRVKEGGGGNNG